MAKKEIKMIGVREYNEKMDVELIEIKGRLAIKAYNEAGFNSTVIDLKDIIVWVNKTKPELLKKEND